MAGDRSVNSLTRESLYDLVWSAPLVQLAPEFGISDVALNKRCKKLGVPTPGTGYWAKVAAGQHPKKKPLPTEIPPKPKSKPKSLESMVYFMPQAKDYSLHRPLPVIKATQLAFGRNKDSYGIPYSHGEGAMSVSVSRDGRQRLLWILNKLLHELEARGVKLDVQPSYGGGLKCSAFGEVVTLIAKERVRRFDNPEYDPKESWPDQKPPYLYRPSGYFKIKALHPTWFDSEWEDKASKPLDDRIAEVAQGILDVLKEFAKRKVQEAERRKQAFIEEQRRWEIKKQREAEAARITTLIELAGRLATREQVLELANRVEDAFQNLQITEDQRRALKDWLEWARQKAQDLDPVAVIMKEFATNSFSSVNSEE